MKTNLKQNSIGKGHPSMVFMWIALTFFFVWLLSISGIISLSWFYSFEEIVAWKAEKIPYFQEILSQHNISLLHKNYLLARIISVFLWVISIASGVLLIIKRKVFYRWGQQIYGFIIRQWVSSKQAFLTLKIAEKIIAIALFLASIALRIYHFSYLPIHVDELMTYYSFVNEGFLLTTLYYPIPNNHVFFNYIFILFRQLIDDPILAARIPSALAFHFMLLLLFFGLLRYFKSFSIALLSASICIFFFPSSIYAAEGRGYAVLGLMVMLAAFSLLLITEKNQKEALFIFIPACIIGAWTVPVFLIPFLSLIFFWLWAGIFSKSRLLFKWMIASAVCVGIGVFISYLPMFLFSGIGAIAANDTVVPVHTANFFTYIYPVASAEILSFFAGTETKGWAIFLVFGLLALVIYRKADKHFRRWMLLSLSVLVMIFLYALLGRRFMFQRTITYTTYFLYPATAIILVYGIHHTFKVKFVRRVVLSLTMISIPFLSYMQYQRNVFEASLLPDEYYNVLNQHLDQAIEEGDKVYLIVSEDYMYVTLCGRYFAETKNLKLVNHIDEASMLIIEESMINELNSDELFSFQQIGRSPALASFLNTLLFYKRK